MSGLVWDTLLVLQLPNEELLKATELSHVRWDCCLQGQIGVYINEIPRIILHVRARLGPISRIEHVRKRSAVRYAMVFQQKGSTISKFEMAIAGFKEDGGLKSGYLIEV